MWGQHVNDVARGETFTSFKSDLQNLKINSKTDGDPMARGQDFRYVTSPVKTSKKPRCCILSQLQVGKRFLGNARKKRVTVIQLGEN